MLLTPDDKDMLTSKCEQYGIDINRTFIDRVPHDTVAHYLSAADFAFSTIKPAPSRKFCSPIKHGEYWANGLPVVVTNDAGDDDKITAASGMGVVWNCNSESPRTSTSKVYSV